MSRYTVSFLILFAEDCLYLNNVKSFYLSTLTSRYFRETFIDALGNLLPRRICRYVRILNTNSRITDTRYIQREIILPLV